MTNDTLAYKLQGMISFPCCEKEKIMVYVGSAGKCSIKCPKCGKYAVFDYDNMISEPAKALRGASHNLRRTAISPSR